MYEQHDGALYLVKPDGAWEVDFEPCPMKMQDKPVRRGPAPKAPRYGESLSTEVADGTLTNVALCRARGHICYARLRALREETFAAEAWP